MRIPGLTTTGEQLGMEGRMEQVEGRVEQVPSPGLNSREEMSTKQPHNSRSLFQTIRRRQRKERMDMDKSNILFY